jgi:TonB family protein
MPAMSVTEDRVTVLQESFRAGVLWLSLVALPLVLIAQEWTSGTAITPPNVPPCPAAQPVEYPEHMVSPKYPKTALASGVEGPVELSAVVSPDAKTKDLRVVSGDPILVSSALKAIHQWRFRPVLVKGKPVETTYKVKIRFNLLLQEAISDVEVESPRQTSSPPETPKPDPSEGEVYQLGQTGVIGPKPIYSPNPEFSEKALQAREQGIVTVSVIVDTDDHSRHPTVVCSSVPDLNETAIEAVKTWRFEPGTKDGKPVAVKIGVEVSFHLYQ